MNSEITTQTVVTPLSTRDFLPAIALTLIFALCGAWLGYSVFLSYKSSAAVEMGMSLSEFKLMSQRLGSAKVFDDFAEHAQKTSDNKDLQLAQRLNTLRSRVTSAQSKWFEPLARVSKQDAKDFGELTKVDKAADLVGYSLTATAASAEEAQSQIHLQSDYVLDASLKETLLARHASALVRQRAAAVSTEGAKTNQVYNIAMLEKRLTQLKRIALAYPTVNRSEARQVISLDKSGERYMPLPSQMAAVETEMMDIREAISRSERGLLQSQSEGDMLAAHGKLVAEAKSGKDLLTALSADIATRIDLAREEHQKALYLGHANEIAGIKARYIDLPRFIVAPELPLSPTKSPKAITLLFALLGLFAGLAYQFRRQLKLFVAGLVRDEESGNPTPLRVEKAT
jgi:hypothetical protein